MKGFWIFAAPWCVTTLRELRRQTAKVPIAAFCLGFEHRPRPGKHIVPEVWVRLVF